MSETESQVITKDYILSLLNERDLLLICLNKILVKDLTIKIDLNNELINELLGIHCTHSDSYVKYICGKILIDCVFKDNHNIKCLFQTDCWHCFPHLCKLLSNLLTKIPIEKCVDFQALITDISYKLNQLCEPQYSYCQNHCLCYTLEIVNHIFSQTSDHTLNNIVLTLIKLYSNQQKRCFNHKFFNLLNSIVKDNESNLITMKSISEWIFDQSLFNGCVHIENVFYGFGGKYSSDLNEVKDEYECDLIMLRKYTLLYLTTLSSTFVMKSTTNQIINSRLKNIRDFVRNKCNKMSENNWIISLFIEEDVQLLTALYSVLKLNENQLSHLLMNEFMESIHSDSSVLLDMLCNDDETATNLLKLLVIYLKLSDITDNIAVNVRNVLLELCDKIERLTSKKLFPYNVKPLIKLLNKLKQN